jgi:hypothetical protein
MVHYLDGRIWNLRKGPSLLVKLASIVVCDNHRVGGGESKQQVGTIWMGLKTFEPNLEVIVG